MLPPLSLAVSNDTPQQEYIPNPLLLDPGQSVIPGQPVKSSAPEPRKVSIVLHSLYETEPDQLPSSISGHIVSRSVL